MTVWPIALETVLSFEGGFANHAHDPGGATFAGVSLRAAESLDADGDGVLDFDLDGDGDVDRHDIAALAGRPDLVERFYKEHYWNAARCSELPPRLAILTFDAAVHHGVGAAALLLQRAVGVKRDAVIGPKTINAAWNSSDGAKRFLTERAVLMNRIVAARPASAVFLEGWLGRCFALALQVSAWRAS